MPEIILGWITLLYYGLPTHPTPLIYVWIHYISKLAFTPTAKHDRDWLVFVIVSPIII